MWTVLLAAAGIAALVRNVVVAGVRAVRSGVESYATRAIAQTRAGHGDLTGMQEARNTAMAARRMWMRASLQALFWLVLLVAPALTPWAAEAYAVAALLWVPVLIARRGTNKR